MDIVHLQRELEHSVNLLGFIATLDDVPKTRIGRIALESLAGANGFTLPANEGIGDWFKSVWTAIWTGIKNIYQWIKDSFRKAYQNEVRKLAEKDFRKLDDSVALAKRKGTAINQALMKDADGDKIKKYITPQANNIKAMVNNVVVEEMVAAVRDFHLALREFFADSGVLVEQIKLLMEQAKDLVEYDQSTPDELLATLNSNKSIYAESDFIKNTLKPRFVDLTAHAGKFGTATTDLLFQGGTMPRKKTPLFLIDTSVKDFGLVGRINQEFLHGFKYMDVTYQAPDWIDKLPVYTLTPATASGIMSDFKKISKPEELEKYIDIIFRSISTIQNNGLNAVHAARAEVTKRNPTRDTKPYLDALVIVARDFLKLTNAIQAAASASTTSYNDLLTGLNVYVSSSSVGWYNLD